MGEGKQEKEEKEKKVKEEEVGEETQLAFPQSTQTSKTFVHQLHFSLLRSTA